MSDSAPPPPPHDPNRPQQPPAAGPDPSSPPPGQPAQPAQPPPGQSARPRSSGASGMTSDQLKSTVQSAHKFDLAQIGLALVIFIASLMPFYSYSFEGGGFKSSASVNAWHGFFGWFAVLLALAAGVVLVVSFLSLVTVPSMRLVVLGLFAVATVCLILALFVMPGGNFSGPGYDAGHGFGYWLALLCSLGAAALAFMRKDATAEHTV